MKNKIYPIFYFATIVIYFLLPFKISAQQPDTLKKKHQLFELSFGQSLLFISNSKLIDARSNDAVVIPTSSILFFVELRIQKKLRVPVFFNLATESKQFIINNQLVSERASPTFGTGLECKLFHLQIDAKSALDAEVGPLISCLINKDDVIKFVPVIAGRVRIMRGENFVMYIGASYSFFINSWGLLYGTGAVF